MRTPQPGEEVTLVVPQREQLPAEVVGVGLDWIDLRPLHSPRTALDRRDAPWIFVQFVDPAEGLCRLAGTLQRPDDNERLQGRGYARGETWRLRTKGHPQLLRRTEAVRGRSRARITLLRADAAAVAFDATAVEIGGAGLVLRGLSFARPGELYSFDLHLEPGRPAVNGQVRVDRMRPDGLAEARITVIAPLERRRLLAYAVDHAA